MMQTTIKYALKSDDRIACLIFGSMIERFTVQVYTSQLYCWDGGKGARCFPTGQQQETGKG